MQENPSVDWRERAEDNERLRRLLMLELESTRDELAAATADSTQSRAEMLELNDRRNAELAQAHDALARLREAGDSTRAELESRLAQAEAELATTQETVRRQAAHIGRLKQQLKRPFRIIAKRALGGVSGRPRETGAHDR